ncbi:MAG: ABC transporter permease [Acetatifactor sp.]|nr:ABC transporter permease [Acetatifactor sp.]
MRKFIGLTQRNLLVFFKDKTMIFFSMLTPLIIFVLYLLFLRDTYVNALEESAGILLPLIHGSDVDAFVNGLLLSGIMGSSLITIPYNCLVTLISDREAGIDVDLTVTPASRLQIILAYFTAAAISAFLMTSIIMGIGLFLLQLTASTFLTVKAVLKLMLLLFIGSVSSTAIFMLIVLFIRTTSASGAFLGILSAVSGFIIGAYIPLSGFASAIRNFCQMFPATGITVLLRDTLLSGVLDHVNDSIGGIDQGLFTSGIRNYFTFQIEFFGNAFSWQQTCFYVIMITMAAILAISLIYPKVYQKK